MQFDSKRKLCFTSFSNPNIEATLPIYEPPPLLITRGIPRLSLYAYSELILPYKLQEYNKLIESRNNRMKIKTKIQLKQIKLLKLLNIRI